MYSREDVELALEGLAEGMSVREVCEMVGCDDSSVRDWAAGRLPRSYTGAPPPPRRATMAPLPGEGREGAVTDEERAAYEVCLVKLGFRKRARLSFGFRHERFSGFGAGAPLAS